ncbi:hypothetical protein L4D76_08305 [Photobacterium sagamiensis]|uniref:hypothetical protein n=1 Tax=Photobacterium sagamiensis TaxID=2910241 RepID=UPI003D0F8103
MIKRTFYRIDEISDITSLTKGDLLDAVERQDLALCAWIEDKGFGLVSKTNALLGLFDYHGTVSLTKEETKTLFCEGKSIRLERFKIHEPERIKAIVDCRERFATLPNSTFSEIRYQSTVPVVPFEACGPVGEIGESLLSLLQVSNKHKKKIENGQGRGFFSDALKAYVTPHVKSLGIQSIEIKPEQLRFDIRKLAEHFGLDCLKQTEPLTQSNRIVNQTKPLLNQPQKLNKPKIDTNPIRVMIRAILVDYPNADSNTIWNLLRTDTKKNPRKYDVDGIVDEINRDEIVWFGRDREKQRVMSYKTFQNNLSSVRKSLEK